MEIVKSIEKVKVKYEIIEKGCNELENKKIKERIITIMKHPLFIAKVVFNFMTDK